MQPSDPTLQQCRTGLQRLYGTRLKGVVLYGSCTRGTEATESDIDLMVLLEGPGDAARPAQGERPPDRPTATAFAPWRP
jgi:predicted nucleotidyltransferase